MQRGWSLKKITRLLDSKAPTITLNDALVSAAKYRRKDIVLLLLDRGADINLVGSEYRTALTAAASMGNTRTVSLLLDRGADINMVFGEYGTALAAAASRGNKDTVSLLLDRGAKINMVCGEYGTALTAAAATYFQNEDVLSLLLKQADINMVGGEYGTALAAAACKGKIDTVKMLLEKGANINMVGGKYGTALAAAAYGGNKQTVTWLLDHGANINLVGGRYGTALAAASFHGNTGIVSLLLDRGADVNMVVEDGKYGNALAAAAWEGHLDTVKLLLDRGAEIKLVGGEYGTALAAAAFHGNRDSLSLLLDRGADVNMVGGKYGTALAAAAHEGKTKTVLLLLDWGADINKVGEYGTAFTAAAGQGRRDTMSLLLRRGADINKVGGDYGTALAAAAFEGKMETVLLLLDWGADINLVGGKYGTALAAAAFSEIENTDIMNLLLDRRAEINLVGGKYGTALAAAAHKRQKDTVLMLLGRGADTNLVGGEYGTALAAGISYASKDTVPLHLHRRADINIVDSECIHPLRNVLEDMDAVPLLLGRGADINLVTSKFGTVLGQAIYRGCTKIALFLLENGADVLRVGGFYPASGMYPSALDVAHSEGSTVDPSLLLRLQTAIRERHGSLVDDIISRSPFPMPHSALCANPPQRELSTSFSATQFRAGSNITPEQADALCRDLDEQVLCDSLTALVGLHEGTTQSMRQWTQNDVRYFVACNYDFGLAYAAARVAWKNFNDDSKKANDDSKIVNDDSKKFNDDSKKVNDHSKKVNDRFSSAVSIYRSQWHKHAQLLDEAREKAIEIVEVDSVHQELILSPYSIKPRRLWDLRSNRVVDFRMLHAAQSTIDTIPTFWAVTHSWTGSMSPVWTTVNQHQWPVPLPKDISLEYLRSELLTLGAEYVWIDVLCLRQQSEVDSLEQIRKDEWKLDVPTTGNIYCAATQVVRYFNGLGVRFSNRGWDDPRHWLQRAWTLQEIADEKIIINGGIPRDLDQVLLNSKGKVSGKVLKFGDAIRPAIKLAEQVQGCDIYELAREMTRRHASQPLDKLFGLFYLLRTTKLPCYDATKTSEDIWRQCFYLLPAERKAEILLNFPYRGSDEQWFPTWAQVLDWPVRDPGCDHKRSQILPVLKTTSGEASLISNIWTIPNVIVSESTLGEYGVKIGDSEFAFYPPYLSQKPIDIGDPVFTLATADLGHAHNWVVCKAVDKQRVEKDIDLGVAEFNVLKKIGVIRTDYCSELLAGGLLQKMDCIFV